MEDIKKEELKYSYLSLINGVEETKEKLKEELINVIDDGNFEKGIYYFEIAEKISKVEDILKGNNVEKENNKEMLKTDIAYKEEPIIDIGIPMELDDDFANTKPIGYVFLGEFQETISWRDLYKSICKKFYNLNPDIITSFNKKKNLNGIKSLYFSKNPKKLRTPYYIGDKKDKEKGIYIDVYKSSREIANLIIKIAKEYNIDKEQITIYIDENFERKNSKQNVG